LPYLTAGQFDEWVAYDQIEPLGVAERLETSIAILCSVVVNIMRAAFSKGRGKPASPGDFLPPWSKIDAVMESAKIPVKQSTDDMKSILSTIVKVTKGNKGMKRRK